MATWQYEVSILSASDIKGDEIHENTYDKLKGWNKNSFYKKITDLLSLNMQKSESWSKSLETWGEEDKTCFKIFFESENILEIVVRIDLRSGQGRIVLNNIVAICNILDGVIVNTNLKLLPPNQESIIEDLKLSKAYKFISNPKLFLENL